MRRILLRLIGLIAATLAAALGWVLATLPPRAARPAVPPAPPGIVSGAYHVHSTRSDGSGSVDAIAAAAERAGLRFVIVTDHGDATRVPDPPQYLHHVLCIDAVEISSTGGHVVAIGMRSPSPFPMAGEPRDVIEDIHRLGGWAIAAHPDSPRLDLRWRGSGAAVDGVEWLNVDSEWRRTTGSLVGAALRSWFRPAESVASLFGSGQAGLDAWQAASGARPVFAIAALDAHARFGLDTDEGKPARALALSWPNYETMFRTVAQTVQLDRPLGGDAAADAAAVIAALVAGRSYSVVRAFVDVPHALVFEAASDTERIAFGGAVGLGSPVTLHAAVPASTGARLVVIRDGREVAAGEGTVTARATEPGAYRVEARLSGQRMPWIVSNAIRVGGEAVTPAAAARPAAPAADGCRVTDRTVTPIPLDSWVVEAHPASTATIAHDRGELRLAYRLGGGAPAGQYVALATSASGQSAITCVVFTASSPTPIRLSVQIRLPGGVNGQRWRRSVYVDATPRRFSVALADLDPVDRRSSLRPVSARVQSVLLVIDTLNARPGDAGEITIADAGYVPGRPPAEPVR